jgi:hypothetical protein
VLSCAGVVIIGVSGLTKTCSACGAENRDIANYCLKCGQTVANASITQPTSTATTQPASSNQPKVCSFHPQVMAQVYCSDCGMPICLTCARPGVQAVFCPQCHAHRVALSRFPQPRFMPSPLFPYPALVRRPGQFP